MEPANCLMSLQCAACMGLVGWHRIQRAWEAASPTASKSTLLWTTQTRPKGRHVAWQVLAFERRNRPEAWGGSVFGYDDVHRHLAKALPQWRSAGPGNRCPWARLPHMWIRWVVLV